MSASELYRAHTDALLLQARLDATRAVGARDDQRMDQLYSAVEDAAARRFYGHPAYRIADHQDQRTMLAGVLAAHTLHATVCADPASRDTSLPGAVSAGLAALRVGDLDTRLPASRDIHAVVDAVPAGWLQAGMDVLARMLRRSGNELVTSAGQLVRRAATDVEHYREHLSDGWYGLHGPWLLLPREVARAAAVAMVRSGREKSRVAALGGLSRTTLDSWLADE